MIHVVPSFLGSGPLNTAIFWSASIPVLDGFGTCPIERQRLRESERGRMRERQSERGRSRDRVREGDRET